MVVYTEQQRILVVDDEERLTNLLQRQLATAGFEVQVANCGAAALNVVEGQPPDLVILDLRLPDISGYELCWTLRQVCEHPHMPIVILTGVEQCTEELHRQAYGADAYLRKPYDAAELVGVVRSLLR